MTSRLVVLGSCGGYPEPGRACSGFLLEHDGFRVALDLGYGTLSRLLTLLGSTTAAGLEAAERSLTERVFDWRPLPAPGYDLGPFRLESWSLPHYVPDAGVRLSTAGLTVAYTGDTGPDPALAELGRDADLFIVDATDRHQDAAVPDAMNLTARGAGEAAVAAGARRLMLTHFWPGNDRARSAAAAAEAFAGEILLADEGAVVDLP
jgi:ribonuclease BN (tRNA processing enzyme)